MGKRQEMREKRQRKQNLNRLAAIGLVTLGAILLAFLLIYPTLPKPVGEIVTVEPNTYPAADGRELGDPAAPVLIEVWEDFQCPACRDFSQGTEPRLVESFVATGQARYVYRHYSFLDGDGVSRRGESDQAANASMCAADQEKFWDYHDILFANWNGENQGAFSDSRLQAFAESVGLEMESFNTCFEANTHKDTIEDDFAAGLAIGVQGTPSVFVNGQKVGQSGRVASFDEIAQAVQAELAGQ